MPGLIPGGKANTSAQGSWLPASIASITPLTALIDGATVPIAVLVGHPYVPHVGDRVALSQFGRNYLALPVDYAATPSLGMLSASSTANQNVANGSWTPIAVATSDVVRGSDVTRSGNVFTVTATGRYKADIFVQWPAGTGRRLVGMAFNAQTEAFPPFNGTGVPPSGSGYTQQWSKEFEADAGDTATGYFFQDSGGTLITVRRVVEIRRIY